MAAAFNTGTINHLQNTVRALFYRRQKVGKLILTFEEYIQTFVPAEAREAFRDNAKWVKHENRTYRWDLQRSGHIGAIETINATMTLYEKPEGPPAPPVPRSIMIQGDAPKEVISKIYHWAERGGDASREFGRVAKVLSIMNENFSRVAIRYYWPTILAICSETGSHSSLVQELQDLRIPSRLKPLPPGLMSALRLTAETIATARLIPSDAEDPAENVVIDIVAGQQYTEDFGSFWGLG